MQPIKSRCIKVKNVHPANNNSSGSNIVTNSNAGNIVF